MKLNNHDKATAINTLAAFCGSRDVPTLSKKTILAAFGTPQADCMVLFGGSILAGGDVLADAMKAGVAKKYIIVGGAGHTTQTLREKMRAAFPDIDTAGRSEAEIFNAYLQHRYGLCADYLETESTNCGNNITNMLKLMDENGIHAETIILAQDATMQRRMAAGLRLHRPDMRIINYATYQARVADDLSFTEDIWGMWNLDRYVELLLGEIPRLRDDGYGPGGKGYIAHEDIPAKVEEAFELLSREYKVRKANPAFAGKHETCWENELYVADEVRQ